jgi:serine/threonine-protein kinase
MGIESVSNFVDMLGRCRLLEPTQFDELTRALQPRFREAQPLAKELLQRGWLTPYQVNQLFQGRGGDLVLGSYVLLERLGEGGMGQVYKARHRRLGRLVALKLIRKERLANPAAVLRFHREIQAAAQLAHPNIVMAYDADAADGVHFYTMEFVEGTTLGRLVLSSGALPVPLACECARQAACGLAHAFDRGLVHRDVNPTNLMLTWTSPTSNPQPSVSAERHVKANWGAHNPLVKVLDMGLARVHSNEDGKPITQFGILMGTPDFIAPEQARDARQADTRSDLYSLGCTLYFLLTGMVPFPGGTRMEKVLRHQSEVARPLEELRSGIPPAVSAVVRRLMAKRPEERYHTPAELVAVLGDERLTR